MIMGNANGVPVRLVRNDGGLIELACTEITLDVDRGVSATPLIFMGSERGTVDLNLSKAVILLRGVFTDDDLGKVGQATAAQAYIDFSRTDYFNNPQKPASTQAIGFSNKLSLLNLFASQTVDTFAQTTLRFAIVGGSSFSTTTNIYAAKASTKFGYDSGSSKHFFAVTTTNGVETVDTIAGGSGYTATGEVATTGGSGSGCIVSYTNSGGAITAIEIIHPGKNYVVGDTVTVAGGSSGTFRVATRSDALTEKQMANNLTDLINSTGLGANNISNFSATQVDSTISGESLTGVVITQANADTDALTGNGKGPDFNGGIWNSSFKPYFTLFKGGRKATGAFAGMSAGDKVMSLWATLNNSNNGGLPLTPVGGIGKLHELYLSAFGDEVPGGDTSTKHGDYIIGIQIPFNSSLNADSAEKYSAVNFFMPTGALHTTSTKHVTNAKPAGEPMHFWLESYQGIKGVVTKATFVRMAGEPIYNFDIQFIPTDYIL